MLKRVKERKGVKGRKIFNKTKNSLVYWYKNDSRRKDQEYEIENEHKELENAEQETEKRARKFRKRINDVTAKEFQRKGILYEINIYNTNNKQKFTMEDATSKEKNNNNNNNYEHVITVVNLY